METILIHLDKGEKNFANSKYFREANVISYEIAIALILLRM